MNLYFYHNKKRRHKNKSSLKTKIKIWLLMQKKNFCLFRLALKYCEYGDFNYCPRVLRFFLKLKKYRAIQFLVSHL